MSSFQEDTMHATSNDVDTLACSRSSRRFLNPSTMQPDVTASNPTAHPGASGPKCRIAVSGLPSTANAADGVVSKEVTVSRGSFSCFIWRLAGYHGPTLVSLLSPATLALVPVRKFTPDSTAAMPGQLAAHETQTPSQGTLAGLRLLLYDFSQYYVCLHQIKTLGIKTRTDQLPDLLITSMQRIAVDLCFLHIAP